MKENRLKTQMQYRLADDWFAKGCRGTYVLPTGFGKGRVPIIILKHLVDKYGINDILILVPTQSIRDTVWTEEITKWIGKEYLKNVDIQCIQNVYLERRERQFVIADEVHNYLADYDDYISQTRQYVKFLSESPIKYLIGLTAYIPKKKKPTANEICPVYASMSVEEAVERSFISNFYILNIETFLTIEEDRLYESIEDKINELSEKLGGKSVAYSNAQYILKGLYEKNVSVLSQDNRVKFGLASNYMRKVNERMQLLNNSKNKISICNTILDSYKHKTIVFSANKEFADSLTRSRTDTASYHSGVSKKKRVNTIEEFKNTDSLVKNISAVRAMNEGVNVPKVKLGILASGNSTKKDFIQRLGRSIRITDDSKSAYFIQLYIPNTQDEKWMKSRIEGINKERVRKVNIIDAITIINN